MFRVTTANLAQQRTIRELYAQHQATEYGGFLDPNWNKAVDIYPGMVMTKTSGEQFTLFTGAANTVPFGLSALFVAPSIGIDESLQGGNLFTVWTGGPDAVFEVLAPAFDTTASWVNGATDVPIYSTAGGKITNVAGTGALAAKLGRLINVVSATKIVVSIHLPVI